MRVRAPVNTAREAPLLPIPHDERTAPAVVALGELAEAVQCTPEPGLLARGHIESYGQQYAE
jgi:hypothetical protein